MKAIDKLLVEVETKHNLTAKLPGNLQQNLDEWYRVELTYTSNAIEGNTLSRAETALVVEKGITVAGKSIREHLEAINHAEAWEWIGKQVGDKKYPTEKLLLDLHQKILQKIDENDSGSYRKTQVRIAGSRTVLPNYIKVPDLMSKFFEWLKLSEKSIVATAIEAHLRLVSIHPFADGNGRTARLLMNWLLILAEYPPIVVRKEDREEYLSSLELAQTGGSKERYQKLMLDSLVRSLDMQGEMMNKKTNAKPRVKLLKIGELAKAAGESVPTIRHWTRMGLLTTTEKTTGGYQLYDASEAERAKTIRELQVQKRLSLEEIRHELG